MRQILAATLVGLVIGLIMGAITLGLLSDHIDNIGGPIVVAICVLTVLLSVGAVERFVLRRPSRHQDDPPKGKF